MRFSSDSYPEHGMRSFSPQGKPRKAASSVHCATKHLRFHFCHTRSSCRSMHVGVLAFSSRRELAWVRVRFSVTRTYHPVGCPGQSSVPGSGLDRHVERRIVARANFTCRIIGAESENLRCSQSVANPMPKSTERCLPWRSPSRATMTLRDFAAAWRNPFNAWSDSNRSALCCMIRRGM
jgi:hypothetical protein